MDNGNNVCRGDLAYNVFSSLCLLSIDSSIYSLAWLDSSQANCHNCFCSPGIVMYRSLQQLVESLKEITSHEEGDYDCIIYSDDYGTLFNIKVPLVNGVREGEADLVQGIRKVATLSYKNNEINGLCTLYGDHNEVVERIIYPNGRNNGPYARCDRYGDPIERGEYTDSPPRPSSNQVNPHSYQSQNDRSVSDFSYSSPNSGFDGGSLLGVLGVLATAAAVGYGVKKAADYFNGDDRSKQQSRNNQASRSTNPPNRNRQYGGYHSNGSNRSAESDNPFGFFF